MPVAKITRPVVDRLQPEEKTYIVFDTELKGFGARVTPTGHVSYILEYRPGSGGRGTAKRRVSIGDAAALPPDQARKLARQILADITKGADPAAERAQERSASTVAALVDAYMESEVAAKRKASTAGLYRIYYDKHIKPELGSRKAPELTHADVARWHRNLGKTAEVTANRALMALSGAFTWGIREGLVKGPNPCVGVQRFREQARERFLSHAELARLAEAIAEAETDGIEWTPDPEKKTKHAPRAANRRVVIDQFAAAAIRLLLLTGARLREILHLRWEEVDLDRGMLLLSDSKTGRKPIILSSPAAAIIATLPRVGPFVIAGASLDKPRSDLHRPWGLVSKRAGLEGVRLHDLRHTNAAFGAGAGLGLPVIGRLLGHAQASTTQRYAHLADDPLRQAANMIGERLVAAMGGKRNG